MRVAYDLTALQLDRGGTARAIRQTLPLLKAEPGVELVELEHGGAVPRGRLGAVRRGLAREFWYLPRALPRAVARSRADLLHVPSQLAPVSCSVPQIITLYDAIGWDHPEWLTRANVAQLHRRVPKMMDAGAHMITSSFYSRGRLLEVFGVQQERISVVPLGLDSRFTPESRSGDDDRLAALGVRPPFIFTVGTLQPRKNLGAAIAAFERLDNRADHQLVIAGARGWHDDALIKRIARSPASKRVILLGHVVDDDLIALYRAAECFVFPSRYEGFGFPPLEAMACGTPVLSSTRTSLAEVVGEAVVKLDPDDDDQIAEALDALLASPAQREALAALGLEQARGFTWQRTADETVEVYKRVLA